MDLFTDLDYENKYPKQYNKAYMMAKMVPHLNKTHECYHVFAVGILVSEMFLRHDINSMKEFFNSDEGKCYHPSDIRIHGFKDQHDCLRSCTLNNMIMNRIKKETISLLNDYLINDLSMLVVGYQQYT
jgi:hypothetical protein